jgi:hypothetical protein
VLLVYHQKSRSILLHSPLRRAPCSAPSCCVFRFRSVVLRLCVVLRSLFSTPQHVYMHASSSSPSLIIVIKSRCFLCARVCVCLFVPSHDIWLRASHPSGIPLLASGPKEASCVVREIERFRSQKQYVYFYFSINRCFSTPPYFY